MRARSLSAPVSRQFQEHYWATNLPNGVNPVLGWFPQQFESYEPNLAALPRLTAARMEQLGGLLVENCSRPVEIDAHHSSPG